MSKDYLEELEKLTEYFEPVENEPSEVLECLKSLDIQVRFMGILDVPSWEKYLPIIKQALLKAQEQEKELGCPLEVVAHLVMNKPFYYKDSNGVLHEISSYDLINKKLIFYLNWEDPNMYEDIEISLSEYSKTFWLKAEKEE